MNKNNWLRIIIVTIGLLIIGTLCCFIPSFLITGKKGAVYKSVDMVDSAGNAVRVYDQTDTFRLRAIMIDSQCDTTAKITWMRRSGGHDWIIQIDKVYITNGQINATLSPSGMWKIDHYKARITACGASRTLQWRVGK